MFVPLYYALLGSQEEGTMKPKVIGMTVEEDLLVSVRNKYTYFRQRMMEA